MRELDRVSYWCANLRLPVVTQEKSRFLARKALWNARDPPETPPVAFPLLSPCFCNPPLIGASERMWTISRRRIALSRNSPVVELPSKRSRTTHGRRCSHRWRAAPIAVFVIPAVLCASAVKLARASICYKAQPILCDGVDDDDTAESILCALPEETTRKLSSAKATPHPYGKGKVPCAAIFRPRVTPAATQQLTSSPDSPLRFKRLLALRAGSSEDPDGSH